MNINPLAKLKSLRRKGFKVESKEEYSDDIDEGDVISQSLKGKSVDEGSTISFWLFLKGKSDSSDVKTTTESVDVPYTGKNDKSQKVKVYIKDKDNDGSTEKVVSTLLVINV